MLLLGTQAQRLFGASGSAQRDRPRHFAKASSAGISPASPRWSLPQDKILYSGAFGKRDSGLRHRRPARLHLPDRFHDQGHHFGRGDAAGRTREAEARRAGGEASSGTGQARRDPRVRSAAGKPVLRPAMKPITLRHLLTHTSGFAYPIWSEEMFKYIAGDRRLFRPAWSRRWCRWSSSRARAGSTAIAPIGPDVWWRRSAA